MVSVECQSATRTLMQTLREGFLLSMATLRTVLTRVGGVDRYHSLTSICCFVCEVGGKLRPSRIMNTLGEAMIVDHLVDRQVFDGNHIEAVDDASALLMREVAAPVGNPFMDSANNLAALRSLRCSSLRSRQLALRALQVFFVGAQELRAWRRLASGKGGKTQQPYVNAYGFAGQRQGVCLHLTGNRRVPFPGKGTMSYNCGEDGLYGTAFAVETPEEACAKFHDRVVEYRKKYGGKRCAEEPWPQAPADRMREYEERLRQRRDEPPAQAVMPVTDPSKYFFPPRATQQEILDSLAKETLGATDATK